MDFKSKKDSKIYTQTQLETIQKNILYKEF